MSDDADSEPEGKPEGASSGFCLEKSVLQAICTESAALIADGLLADRTAVVYQTDEGYLTLGGKQDFPRFTLYHNAPISLTVLEDAAIRGRTTLSHDARDDHETAQTLTLQLSEAVSLLCVPFFDSEGAPAGAIYADTTSRVKAFRHKELRFVREFADWLSSRLQGQEDVPPPEKRVAIKAKAPEDSAPKPGSSEESPSKIALPTIPREPGTRGYIKRLVAKIERFVYYR